MQLVAMWLFVIVALSTLSPAARGDFLTVSPAAQLSPLLLGMRNYIVSLAAQITSQLEGTASLAVSKINQSSQLERHMSASLLPITI
jgi:hypothetical protein